MNSPQDTFPTPAAATAAATTKLLVPRELAEQPVQLEQCASEV